MVDSGRHSSYPQTITEEVGNIIERLRHALQRAGRELGVVPPVAGGGAGVHDVVALPPAGTAVVGVVRRAEVVTDLVGQGDLRHLIMEEQMK